MRNIRLLCLTFFVFLSLPYLYADQLFSNNEWIGCGEVFGIKTDPKGFMWFLTNNSIKKFDGKQLLNYDIIYKGKVLSFSPNYNYIFNDSKNNLWLACKNGLIYKYCNSTDKFELQFNLYSLSKKDNINLSYIYLDKEDNFWMCNHGEQYIYDTKNNTTHLLYHIIKDDIHSIEQISSTEYVISGTKKIYTINLKNGVINNLRRNILEKNTFVLYTYYNKETEDFIFFSRFKGIFIYNLKTKELSHIQKSFINVGINAVKPYFGDKNSILIATNGSGMYLLDIKNRKLSPVYNKYIADNYNFSNNVIKDILYDNENRLWISIFPHGVLKYSKNDYDYVSYKYSPYNKNSLICNQVNDIIEDSDGDYCFATNNGISIYNKRLNKWTNNIFSTYDNEFYNYAFKSICEIDKGIFLIGGYMYGGFLISKKELMKGDINIKDIAKNIISKDEQINSIFKDGNIIWIGNNSSLLKYNLIKKTTTQYNIDIPILCLKAKDNNTLWLGTVKGLYSFDKRTKIKNKIDLSSNIISISSIYQSPKGLTYIGSYNNGIFIYNNKSGVIRNFKADNSTLNSSNIRKILPCRNNNLLITTTKGISYYNSSKQLFINRSRNDEIDNGIINSNAAIRTTDNHYLIGSNEGAIEIDERIFNSKQIKSRIFFYGLSILYKDVVPGEKQSPLKENIDDCNLLSLNYNQNMFSLKVSSINFNNQSNILYTWKLDGFYNGWSRPSKYDVIRFQNVPPGKYKLRVRAILLDNFHILQEKDLNIKITPPIWRSYGAYSFYVLFLILLGYILFRFLWMRRERNEYNNKVSFFINTAHDIKTPLSLIKTPLEEIIKKEKLSEEGLSDANIALKNTQLLTNLTSNLIDFEKEKFLSIINVTRCNLNDFMKAFVDEFKELYKNSNIDIYIHDYTDNIEVLIDKEKIKSILRNIMSNAVKYCREKGEINITLSNTNNRWQVKIRDNGVGITEADQKKLFKYIFRGENAINMKVTGSGIGLLYTYKLIKNHLGTITCNSKINVGTTFIFTFPLYHKKYNIIEEKNDINEIENKVYNYPIQVKEKSIQDINAMLKTKYSIIIAEDNIDMCAFLNNSLSNIYDLRIAYNGQEVLDLVQIKKPDLIISDLMMPVMDGNTLCNKIKNNLETCHIPIILLTALSDKEHIIKGLQIKADVFLTKPFDMDILKANISNLIENRQLIISAYSKINQNFAGENLFNGPELSVDQEFLIKVVSVIRSNLKKDLNVEILCRLINMSRTSFYNRIRAITGNSPSDFIRNIKMDEACKLLKSKRYTVSEVAEMVGFNDPKYFTDIFKKYYNETPSNYMKQS